MASQTDFGNLETLARGQALLEQGNVVLAKREFERLSGGALPSDEISARIAICNKELDKLRGKELAKKGRRSLKKGRVPEAVNFFRQAYALCRDAWLRDKIDELAPRAVAEGQLRAASSAEARQQYDEAADHYARAWTEGPVDRNEVGWSRAHCLVRAERYDEAVAAFDDGAPPERACHQYDLGWALLKVGDLGRCLRVWDGIKSGHEAFARQKEDVRKLLVADLYERLHAGADAADLYADAASLRETFTEPALASAASQLQRLCGYPQISRLWQQRRFEDAARLLNQEPKDMSPALLNLFAKIGFRLAGSSDLHLDELRTYWLTSLYRPDLETTLLVSRQQLPAVRRELMRRARALLAEHDKRHHGAGDAMLAAFNAEAKQLSKIEGLHKAPACSDTPLSAACSTKDRETPSQRTVPLTVQASCRAEPEEPGDQDPTCSPSFAARFGYASRIAALIKANREHFSSEADFLEAGAWYSEVMPCMALLASGRAEEALASLPPTCADEDAFVAHGRGRVMFAQALHCLEVGRGRPSTRQVAATVELFAAAPGCEEEFLAKARQAHDGQRIAPYKDFAMALARRSASPPLRKLAAELACRWALTLGAASLDQAKMAEKMLVQVLELDPSNATAPGALAESRKHVQWLELDEALYRGRLSTAAKIAARSDDEEVHERFFREIEDLLADNFFVDHDKQEQMAALAEALAWCSRIDESHPVTRELERRLDEIGQRSA